MRLLGAPVRHSLDRAHPDVALTFDDGPDPELTPRILDVLRAMEVPATFFLLGTRVAEHGALVERIVREGHAVGSHSWSHPHPQRTGAWRLLADYRRGRRVLERAVGERVRLFRPPHGYVDWRVAAVMRVLGLDPWHWTVDPKDWRADASVEELVAAVDEVAAGDVILMHDGPSPRGGGSARTATAEALGEVVARVRSRGLSFVTLR
jgi:peptidoglycan-N-acetylglucosamine deacetylase